MFAIGPVRLEGKGVYGSTTSVSVEGGHAEIVRLILERGVNVKAKDIHGNTALSYAILRGDETIMSLVLHHGAK